MSGDVDVERPDTRHQGICIKTMKGCDVGHGPDIDPTSTLVVGIGRGLARPARRGHRADIPGVTGLER
jgi:hypothetical protein